MENKRKGTIKLHFTGTIWRPPYEAGSLLLEVTAGCTHHKCKFCTLYDDLPFRFRMSPLQDIEADLLEAQTIFHSPVGKLSAALQGLPQNQPFRRAFLVGANPFVLQFERLQSIAGLIGKYFPECRSIGCFARVTDIMLKTDEQLEALHSLGYDGITIGVETGDGEALAFMRKGYRPEDILTQCRRLDQAGIRYNFFYLAGISGAERGEAGALASAEIFNQLCPEIIGTSMLTVYPESDLYGEIRAGNWREAGELEKLAEVRCLAEHLEIPVFFAMLGASNAVQVQGRLPEDRERLLWELTNACETQSEAALRHYRTHLEHL